jgi:hypothetical protein
VAFVRREQMDRLRKALRVSHRRVA